MYKDKSSFSMYMGGSFMKNFILLLILSLIAIPAFAACSLEYDKPCTASTETISMPVQNERIEPNPFDETREKALQNESANRGIINNQYQETDYNSNCQFGVCLPERK